MVRMFGAAEVEGALSYDRLVPALRAAFAAAQVEAPVRHAHVVGTAEEPGHLLVMPAWRRGDAMGVKVVNVFPANAAHGLGAVHGIYALFDGRTGVPRAFLDAEALTNRRTAAASALASQFLSRPESATLAVMGTGRLAFHLAQGHCAVRPIRRVLVWGRTPGKAAAMAGELAARGLPAEAVEDRAAAVAAADIVSCATTSVEPLVLGQEVGRAPTWTWWAPSPPPCARAMMIWWSVPRSMWTPMAAPSPRPATCCRRWRLAAGPGTS